MKQAAPVDRVRELAVAICPQRQHRWWKRMMMVVAIMNRETMMSLNPRVRRTE